MSLILKSASFNANGDAGRDHDTRAAVENAGYEMNDAEQELEAHETSGLTDEQRLQKNLTDYKDQVHVAKLKYGEEEWNKTLNQNLRIGQAAQIAMLESQNGAEVAFYLGQHPAEAERLGKMTPIAAAQEVGRLSDRLPKPQRTVKHMRPSPDASFAEIAAAKSYPGKIRDLRRAARERR